MTHPYLHGGCLQGDRLQDNVTFPVLLEHAPQALLGGQFQQQAHVGVCPYPTQLRQVGVVQGRQEGHLLSDLTIGVEEMFRLLREL